MINYPKEFELLYAYQQKLARADTNEESITEEKFARLFGAPGSIVALETNLVAMMLVDPENETTQRVIREVDYSRFYFPIHKTIWELARNGAKSVKEMAFQLWDKAGRRTHELPSAAFRAILLVESENWISGAGIEAYAKRLNDVQADTIIKRQILEASRDLASETITPRECLDRISLLRERVAIHGH